MDTLRRGRQSLGLSSGWSSISGAAVLGVGVALALVLGQTGSVLAILADNVDVTVNAFALDNLDPPTALSADDSPADQIDLTWTATVDTYADGYDIYRSVTSGSGYALLDSVTGQSTTAYTDVSTAGGLCTVNPGWVSGEATQQSDKATSIAVSVPSGVEVDDLLLAHIATTGNNPGFTTPTGWTLLTTNTAGQGTGHAVYYRVADGTEPARYTFTWSSDEDAIGVIIRYQGIDTTSPIDASATSHGSSANPVAPTVTTTAADAVVIRLVSTNDDEVVTAPGGHVRRYDLKTDSTGGDASSANADTTQASIGATGTASFTIPTSEAWTTTTIALRVDPTITRRCVPRFEGIESSVESAGVTSIVVSVPAGTVQDDLLIGHVTVDQTATISTPTGWTALFLDQTGGISVGVFYRVANDSEPADYSFSWSVSNDAVASISRYSSTDPTAPIRIWAKTNGGSSSPTAPTLATANDTLVLRLFGSSGSKVVSVPPWHESRYVLATDDTGNDITQAAADQYVASVGDVGTGVFSIGTSEAWTAATLALQPLSPITHVGYITLDSAVDSGGTTSIAVSVPSGVEVDDLLLAHIATTGNNPGFTTPTGWTLLTTNTAGQGTGHAVYYRVADGTEPASYTFTWSSDEDAIGVIIRYQGIDTTSPIDVSATSHGSSTTPVAPTVTTTGADAVVIRLVSTNDDEVVTAPGGHVSRYAFKTDSTGGDNTSATPTPPKPPSVQPARPASQSQPARPGPPPSRSNSRRRIRPTTTCFNPQPGTGPASTPTKHPVRRSGPTATVAVSAG